MTTAVRCRIFSSRGYKPSLHLTICPLLLPRSEILFMPWGHDALTQRCKLFFPPLLAYPFELLDIRIVTNIYTQTLWSSGDIPQCSKDKAKCFRGTYHLYLQDWRIRQTRNHHEAGWFLLGLHFDPEDGGDTFLWSIRFLLNCSVKTHRTVFFIIIAVANSNLACTYIA